MSTLFSYCIPFDDGVAPNSFWGVCTLAICKLVIRRKAEIGDWVVGTGSKRSPIGDISGKVVYAMRVDRTMTMEEFDQHTQLELPDKISQMESADLIRRYDDLIYDFSTSIPSLRPSVHTEKNRRTNLREKNVLLSNYFFYFDTLSCYWRSSSVILLLMQSLGINKVPEAFLLIQSAATMFSPLRED